MASSSSSDRDKELNDAPKPVNPFIKFRQFADAHIGSLLQGIIGLPSAFSKPSGNTGWADFDADLRRRDELQARQKELRDTEAQKIAQQEVEQGMVSCAKPPGRTTMTAPNEETKPKFNEDDIPLFSPVTKSLFAHLYPRGQVKGDWDQPYQVSSWSKEILPEFSLFKLGSDQQPWDPVKNIQLILYNELNSSPAYRSNYSLLPYLLFSPYSPIALKYANQRPHSSRIHEEAFPFLQAFEDLIQTSNPSTTTPRSPFTLCTLLDRHLTLDRGLPHRFDMGISALVWIHSLYSRSILQQKEIIKIPQITDLLPGSPFYTESKEGKADTNMNEQYKEAQTEQDMYDRFLKWASSPTAVADSLESLLGDTEGFFEKQLKTLDSPEGRRAFKETLDSKFGKAFSDLEDMLDSLDASSKRAQVVEHPAAVDLQTLPRDPEKVTSSSTTTERTMHEDGSVETSVTVWKRFADGRESVTTTTHCDNPAWDDKENVPDRRETDDRKEDSVRPVGDQKSNESKGWFWS